MKTRWKAQQGAASRALDTGQDTYIMFKWETLVLDFSRCASVAFHDFCFSES